MWYRTGVPSFSPAAKTLWNKGRTSIHDLTAMYSCALRGPALTYESQGRLRRCAPFKGLRPLRRFAAIPIQRPFTENYFGRRSFLFF